MPSLDAIAGGPIGDSPATQVFAASSIASGEAFGRARSGFILAVASIASADALGEPASAFVVAPAGIASAEAFGSPAGIKRPIAITVRGAAHVAPARPRRHVMRLAVLGIPSAESFGLPAVEQSDDPEVEADNEFLLLAAG